MLAARHLLPIEDRSLLEAHLRSCDDCAHLAAAYACQDAFLRMVRVDELPASTISAVVNTQVPIRSRWTSGTAASRRLGLAAMLVLALVVVSTVVYAAGSVIRVYRPETSPSHDLASFLEPGSALPPYATVRYRSIDPSTAARQSGYAVAFLKPAPQRLSASVGVDVLPQRGWQAVNTGSIHVPAAEAGIGMVVRSIVRYRGGGHTVVVLLNEPSPQAVKTRQFLLGQRTVRLANGREVWLSDDVGESAPFVQPRAGAVHVLAWVEGSYIVSLFSDLTSPTLERLALHTTVTPAAPNMAQRHIPAGWPAPQPLERLPARLRMVVSGTSVYARRQHTLHVAYFFEVSGYSQGGLWGLDRWRHLTVTPGFSGTLSVRRQSTVPTGRLGSGSGGFGDDMWFGVKGMSGRALSEALHAGMAVHLAWVERGVKRSLNVHVDLIPRSACRPQYPSCGMAIKMLDAPHP
jgi:hypothetical protein